MIRKMFVNCFSTILVAYSFSTPVSATLLVDNSPETTGSAVTVDSWVNEYGSQMIGDGFTLANDVVLTGGSIFSGKKFGALGNAAQFLVYSNALAAPLINIVTTIDAVDTQLTGSNPITRKHVSIPNTFLAAGSYWFSLTGVGVDLAQAAGNYDDGSFNFGATGVNNTCFVCGDAFFTLEGNTSTTNVPEPATLALLGLGMIGVLGNKCRRPTA